METEGSLYAFSLFCSPRILSQVTVFFFRNILLENSVRERERPGEGEIEISLPLAGSLSKQLQFPGLDQCRHSTWVSHGGGRDQAFDYLLLSQARWVLSTCSYMRILSAWQIWISGVGAGTWNDAQPCWQCPLTRRWSGRSRGPAGLEGRPRGTLEMYRCLYL